MRLPFALRRLLVVTTVAFFGFFFGTLLLAVMLALFVPQSLPYYIPYLTTTVAFSLLGFGAVGTLLYETS